MKIKTVIFFILLIALIGGMVWVNGEADKINNDIGIAADTIYGDQTAASGLDIGLSFETNGSLLWKSNVAFRGNDTDVNTEFTRGSFDTWDKVTMGFGVSTTPHDNNDALESYVRDTYGKEPVGIYSEGKGYFYITGDAVYSSYLGYDEDSIPEPTGTLPEGNCVFTMEYDTYEGTDFITRPKDESLRSITDFGDDERILSIGLSEDGSHLECIYQKGNDIYLRAVSTGSGEITTDEKVLKEAGDIYAYYPKDLETGDITMIANDKGFLIYENKDGNLSKVMERSFHEEDGPDTLGKWYEDNKYRRRKVYYDGERLAVSFRIARPDPFYKDHRGTAVLVYEGDDLGYVGVIGSELYGIRDVSAPDYYATEYEFGRFIGQDMDELVTEYTDGSRWYEPNEEYKAVQKRNQEADKEEGLESPTDQVFDTMGLGYYDIEYIKKGD